MKSGTQLVLEVHTHVVGAERPSVINDLVILYMPAPARATQTVFVSSLYLRPMDLPPALIGAGVFCSGLVAGGVLHGPPHRTASLNGR
jgi:hypothetical protein